MVTLIVFYGTYLMDSDLSARTPSSYPYFEASTGTNLVPRAFFLRKWEGREKALASADRMTQKNTQKLWV